MKFWYQFFYALIFPLAKLLYPCHINGTENIPEGPMIVCANHTSLLDPVLIAVAFGRKRQLFFMAKAELFKIPIASSLFRAVGVFPVNRGKPDIQAIRTCIIHLKEGRTVMMFPEGTRVSDGADVSAKDGAVRIAVKMKVPILPVFLSGKKRVFSCAKLNIGEPISFSAPADKNYLSLADTLMNKIYSLEHEF